MFGVLPKVFQNMFGGAFIGTVFFLMVLLAALTSSISLMETVVSTIQDKWKMRRNNASLLVFGFSLLLGALSCLGYSAWSSFSIFGKFAILDFFDFATNSIMMPIVALATCIFISFVLKTSTICDEVELSGKFALKKMFSIIIRFIAPVCLLVILVFAILEGFQIIKV